MLLKIDAWINLFLGVCLFLLPTGLASWLGLPPAGHYFYSSILGAVLVGIGFALLLETRRSPSKYKGLGYAGAVIINLCGSSTLIAWLLFTELELALRGAMLLWVAAIVVFLIGLLEIHLIRFRDPN